MPSPATHSEMQEVLAEAYWRNGNRDVAIHAIEKALSLIEQSPRQLGSTSKKRWRSIVPANCLRRQGNVSQRLRAVQSFQIG